jgi:hypothetical protein
MEKTIIIDHDYVEHEEMSQEERDTELLELEKESKSITEWPIA